MPGVRRRHLRNGWYGELKLILYEKERSLRLKEFLKRKIRERPTGVVVACGPEGGFAEKEVRVAVEKGFTPVSLGGRVLRSDTAALATLSILQYEWGDI